MPFPRFLVLMLLLGLNAFGQQVSGELFQAFKSSNATKVASYFDQTVDLSFPGNEGVFSRNQSELMLQDFFTKNPVKNFYLKHENKSADGSVSAIGTLHCQTGVFRVFFYLKKVGDSQQLKELRIEKSN